MQKDIVEKQDRRVKRTQNLLAKALIELTLERGYDTITIRDITQRADVGYTTFFRHYHDKDELLLDVLHVVQDELMDVLLHSSSESDDAMVGLLLFRYVQQHSEIMRVLLSSQGSSSLMQSMIETSIQRALSRNSLWGNDTIPTEIAVYHLVTSCIALIRWWLEHSMPYPPERMGMIYHELIVQPSKGKY